MARKKKTFRPFESCDYEHGFQEPYTTMTRSILTNNRWKSLNYSSQILYIYMKLWSYGKIELEFSYSLAINNNIINSRTTFKNAIDELVNNGFIEIVRISRKPGVGTIYKFSDKWHVNKS